MITGDLLLEAKAQLSHGQWQPWLREHCQFSERAARLYMRLAKNRKVIEAHDIANLTLNSAARLLAPPRDENDEADDSDAETPPAADANGLTTFFGTSDLTEIDEMLEASWEAEDAEAAATLDEPPPAVPPPAPIAPPTDFALEKFNWAVSALIKLSTKPAAQFTGTAHHGGNLISVVQFLHAVIQQSTARCSAICGISLSYA